ncbi:MAG: hypothetical protein KDB22_30375, partial [Planctomycetales bacterium]|nr:hypothetical protein [Planctomycetales bacterium]
NLAHDLSESKDLAVTETAKLTELRRELDAWRKQVGAEMMHLNPDYDPSVKPDTKKKLKKRIEE